MTKSEIISKVAKDTFVSQGTVEMIIDTFLKSIIEEVSKGNLVKLKGFGTFLTSRSKRVKYNNPNNPNEVTTIREARAIPKFRPGKAFCDSAKSISE